jgi:hypothetical protein
MLVIKQNQLNRLALSANELLGLTSNEFLFRFIHQQTHRESLVILTGVVSTRYTLFELTEGAGGDISLAFGSYTYMVYESDGNLETTGKPLLEVGLCQVPKAEVTVNAFIADKETTVYGIPNPNISS